MKLALLCALSAAIPALLLAQPAPDTLWTWTYGGAGMERAVDVNPTSDGGLILAGGRSIGADLPDALLVKLTAAGDLEWTVNYGESSEEAFRVCQTADQGFVAVGYTTAGCMGQDLGNAYVIRLNAQGDSLWTRNLNFGTVDDLYGVLELNNGDILIAGSTVPIPGSVAPLLCRLNANGDSLWSHVYLHPNVVRWVRDLIQLNDGGFALAGFGNNPSGPTLPFALKVNADGDEEWLRTYERDLDADGHSIIEAQDDGFYLCGNGYNEDYQEGFLILRLNAQGDTLWTRLHFTVGNGDWCQSAAGTIDGGLVLGGNAILAGHPVFDLVKLDADGDVEWHRPVERGADADICASVCVLTDGCCAMTGLTANQDFGDICVMKFESMLGTSDAPPLVAAFALSDVYPNPFNNTTQIRYEVGWARELTLRIFDLMGREVLAEELTNLSPGAHVYAWNPTVATGPYFIQLEHGATLQVTKALYLK